MKVAMLAALLGWAGCVGGLEPPTTVAHRYEGAVRSRDVADGERIFLVLCTACHRGRVNPRGYRWTPAQMRQQIREGNRMMPPLRVHRLSDVQVEAVLAYLTTIDAIEGDIPPDPSAPLTDLGPERWDPPTADAADERDAAVDRDVSDAGEVVDGDAENQSQTPREREPAAAPAIDDSPPVDRFEDGAADLDDPWASE